MMSSLFSSFDLNINQHMLPMALTYSLLPLIISLNSFWAPNLNRNLPFNYITSITKTLVTPSSSQQLKTTNLTISFMFYSLLILNITGAVPVLTTITSHLSFTMAIGFPMWLTMLMTGMILAMNKVQANHLPEASPMILSPFLAMVEVISSIIRPITLSFRLAANISAGHVILAMLSNNMTMNLMMYITPIKFLMSLLLTLGYSMFEFAICCVQAYVLILLTIMYTNDYIKPKTN